MATSTTMPSLATHRSIPMNPTTTEHDFRFPRRPTGRGTSSKPQQQSTHAAGTMSSRPQGAANWSSKDAAASDNLLGPALFSLLKDANSDSDRSMTQTQRDDPLATQIWKFFTKTKQQLPHQDRMENITWRMMAVQKRKTEQEQIQKKYGPSFLEFFLFLRAILSPGHCKSEQDSIAGGRRARLGSVVWFHLSCHMLT